MASPEPIDIDAIDLSKYKGLNPAWTDFAAVQDTLGALATAVLSRQRGEKDAPV